MADYCYCQNFKKRKYENKDRRNSPQEVLNWSWEEEIPSRAMDPADKEGRENKGQKRTRLTNAVEKIVWCDAIYGKVERRAESLVGLDSIGVLTSCGLKNQKPYATLAHPINAVVPSSRVVIGR